MTTQSAGRGRVASVASDDYVIPPPQAMSVDWARRPVLYLADGRAVVRHAGFRRNEADMSYGKGGGSAKTPKKSGGKK